MDDLRQIFERNVCVSTFPDAGIERNPWGFAADVGKGEISVFGRQGSNFEGVNVNSSKTAVHEQLPRESRSVLRMAVVLSAILNPGIKQLRIAE